MTSNQEFNCIFCKESFDNKEDLQTHFRKHGDPKFNQHAKGIKSRQTNESQPCIEKSNEESDMVSCDVCSEVFPTISKAITHKHKMHPDHDAKYFCPWCGKFFTMKHLYNIHLEKNHDPREENAESDLQFHCDYCEVDFYVPSAMLYHNKFFHRQDTELAAIGQSRKLKLYNQEPLQLYYCPFCGEEYFNKVNLHKHMADDHSDENQGPNDVLRCPLCDAIFYHLDAYELHLTFHSADDLYSEDNEMANEITEFSLEAVPPIMEKVENYEEDAETMINSTGIENFLQQAMDESVDNDNSNSDCISEKKSKKRKKHKKSKKSAITLDEFLNMNRDVFGEGIDFQGIEEVPTRVVAKQLKSKQTQKVKSGPREVQSTELEKLKKLGIAVKKKPEKMNSKLQGMKVLKEKVITKPAKTQGMTVIPQKKTNAITTENEVLTKLFNQGNTQLKIIKKAAQENSDFKEKESNHSNSSNLNISNTNEIVTNKIKEEDLFTDTDTKTDRKDQTLNNDSTDNIGMDELPKTDNVKLTVNDVDFHAGSNKDLKENINAQKEFRNEIKSCDAVISNESINLKSNSHVEKVSISPKNTFDTLRNLSQHITIKSVGSPNSTIKEQKKLEEETQDIPASEENVTAQNVKEISVTEETVKDSNKNSLNALKHLSHLITVKPVSQPKTISPPVKQVTLAKNEFKDDSANAERDKNKEKEGKLTHKEAAPIIKHMLKDRREVTNSTDVLKNLSKHITIKSSTLLPNKNTIYNANHEDNNELDDDDTETETTMIGNKVLESKSNENFKIPFKQQDLNYSKKSEAQNQFTNYPLKVNMSVPETVKQERKEDINSNDHCIREKTSEHNFNKQLNKPVVSNINQQIIKTSIKSVNINKGNVIQQHVKKDAKVVEIFNIDDSDDELEHSVGDTEATTNLDRKSTTAKPLDALKNLSHITVKSTNQHKSHNKELQSSEQISDYGNDSDQSDCSENNNDYKEESKIPISIQNPVTQKKVTIQNTLKNLGKHITIKSGNSGNIITQTQSPIPAKNYKKNEDYDTDSNSSEKRVNHSEFEDHISDEDRSSIPNNQSPKNMLAHFPHDSNSESDSLNEHESFDIESQIKVNTLKKQMLDIKNPVYLKKLKNISNNVTIKPLKEQKGEDYSETPCRKPDDPVPNLGKDLCMKPLKQTNQVCQELVASCSDNNCKQTIENMALQSKINKRVATSSDQLNTVNKEVTVKTFQTKTVIQEITTTVTKTIKTVNQTVKQEVRNMCQATSMIRPQKIQGVKPNQQMRNYQGIAVRPAPPVAGPRIRNTITPVKRAACANVRPHNQLVPIRPGLNVRPNNPRMPNMKIKPSTSNSHQPIIGKPLKISPNAMIPSSKRVTTDEQSGPFSCFKKQKESLIPVSDVPIYNSVPESDAPLHSTSFSRSDSISATTVVKSNCMVTSTQMKSEVSASSQQWNKLNNMSGLKIVKTSQAKHATQVEEQSEISAAKRTTQEAIEKLQKQGLLVKKPRLNENNYNEYSDSEGDYET